MLRPNLHRQRPRQAKAPHASEIEDAFISQLPQAHHLSDRGSQVSQEEEPEGDDLDGASLDSLRRKVYE